MKAQLIFTLPEDKDDFTYASNGIKYICALWDIKENVRSVLKYNTLTKAEVKVWETVDEMINSKLDEHNVDLNDLK